MRLSKFREGCLSRISNYCSPTPCPEGSALRLQFLVIHGIRDVTSNLISRIAHVLPNLHSLTLYNRGNDRGCECKATNWPFPTPRYEQMKKVCPLLGRAFALLTMSSSSESVSSLARSPAGVSERKQEKQEKDKNRNKRP
ncbi:hypothetical protein PHLGIDRAFT_232205 [Phlebiopsis gigantea 11061_1 CR5-6]|uniref:Uncharacterized protein n=1 Tax=Phlebiopsis gigantea (strain 11061_1 CR5-6) TaxID=745531 RepID=A0A0C3SEH2_PHLG1|nr:hypothetical protein PHLGIDRAFT_232205 [Phlebiopsis gigantea 11061_1 CR5-6]